MFNRKRFSSLFYEPKRAEKEPSTSGHRYKRKLGTTRLRQRLRQRDCDSEMEEKQTIMQSSLEMVKNSIKTETAAVATTSPIVFTASNPYQKSGGMVVFRGVRQKTNSYSTSTGNFTASMAGYLNCQFMIGNYESRNPATVGIFLNEISGVWIGHVIPRTAYIFIVI